MNIGPELTNSHQKLKLLKKKKQRKEKLTVFNHESKSGKQFSFGTKGFKSKISSVFKVINIILYFYINLTLILEILCKIFLIIELKRVNKKLNVLMNE